MAQAIPVLIGASAAMSAVGAYRQGKAAKAVGEYNATINRENAAIAYETTLNNVRQFDREQYLRVGAIKAAQGKAGGRATGSVLDVLADTAAQGEIARQDIIRRGRITAQGYINSANLDLMEGNMANQQAQLKAGADLLGGAGNVGLALKRGK